MDQIAGQAWLDGTFSIVDQRFNDGKDRLPLEALTYWREMSKVVSMRTVWCKCEHWLAMSPDPKPHNADMTWAFNNACTLLPGLRWNTPVSALDTGLTMLKFTKLLGTEWLSGSLVQMMVDSLSARACTDPHSMSSTIIGGPGFVQEINNAALENKLYLWATTPLLCHYEQHIKDSGSGHLYFPAHVNENHWIAVHVNYKKCEFSYGECHSNLYI